MLHGTKSTTVNEIDPEQITASATHKFPDTPVKLSQDSPLILPAFARRMLPLQSPELCNKKTPPTKPSGPVTMGATPSAATTSDSPTARAKNSTCVSDVESSRVPSSNNNTCPSTVARMKDLRKPFTSPDRDLSTKAPDRPNSGIHNGSAHKRDSSKERQQSQNMSPSNKFIQGVSQNCSTQKRHRELADLNQSAKKKRLHFPSTGCISQSSDVSPSLTLKNKFSPELQQEDCSHPQHGVKQMFSGPIFNSCFRISDKKQTLITQREELKENRAEKCQLSQSSTKFCKGTQDRITDEGTSKLPKSLKADRLKSLKHRPLRCDEDELFKPDVVIQVKKADPAGVDVLPKKSSSANQMTSSHHNSIEPLAPKSKDVSITKSTAAQTPKTTHLSNSMPHNFLNGRKCEVKLYDVGNGDKNNPESSCKKVKDEKNKGPKNEMSHSALDDLQTTWDSDVFKSKRSAKEEEPDSDVDSIDLDFPLETLSIHSSDSSDDEPLISLGEVMRGTIKPAKTPEKEGGPRTSGHEGPRPSNERAPTSTKSMSYLNNLDQMLKEIHINRKSKDKEMELLTECAEGRLEIAEYEETKENQEANMTEEQRDFLQCYSVVPSTISEVPPGEKAFSVEMFGRLFTQDTLQLRKHTIFPTGIFQRVFVWSRAAELRLHINTGLLQEAFDHQSPCPTQVSLYLFKMMSVHTERMVSDNIFRELCDLACTSARQIVQHGNQRFQVWVPTLAEVTLVLLNMGVDFVTLYPFESLRPQFTEADVLDSICDDTSSSTDEQRLFSLHNCDNVFKYLSVCMGLCPQVYSDNELLLLLIVTCRVALDPHYIQLSNVELYTLKFNILANFREWDVMLPRLCRVLTDLTDDHHNMCLLLELLPDSSRGRELSQHLGMSMISKLLDGTCTYRVTEREFKLADLCHYLPKMRPSSILKGKLKSAKKNEMKDDSSFLDQESYYLCYSLLTLMKEASNFRQFPSHQKDQLLNLSHDLERHIKCDIRENKKCLYRSRVKDLVARISTKWQMHCRSSKPLNDKLYDYRLPIALQKQACDIKKEDEGSVMEEQPAAGDEDKSVDEKNEADAHQEWMESDETSSGVKNGTCVVGDG